MNILSRIWNVMSWIGSIIQSALARIKWWGPSVPTPAASVKRPSLPKNSPDRRKPNGVELWLKAQIKHYERLIKAREAEHAIQTPDVNERLFWLIVGVTVAILLIGVTTTYYVVPTTAKLFELPFSPPVFIYLILTAYTIGSFRVVGVDQVGGADFFGTPVMQFGRGLKWVPLGIMNFRREYATFVQSEFPGDADHIEWRDEKEALPAGKVRPIYALTGEDRDGKLPTDRQMNIGMSALAKFQVVPDRFFDFVMNVGPVDAAKKDVVKATITGGENVSDFQLEVVRHLRDTTTTVLIEVVGQLSLNEMTKHMHLVNLLYWRRLEETVVTWGIRMVEVRVTKMNPGHEFNAAIQQRGTAMARRDAAITDAEGEKKKRILEGEGTAAAEKALLEARAKGYAKIAEVARTPEGQVALASDVAGKLAESEANTVVVGADGIRDLLGLAAAVKKGTK